MSVRGPLFEFLRRKVDECFIDLGHNVMDRLVMIRDREPMLVGPLDHVIYVGPVPAECYGRWGRYSIIFTYNQRDDRYYCRRVSWYWGHRGEVLMEPVPAEEDRGVTVTAEASEKDAQAAGGATFNFDKKDMQGNDAADPEKGAEGEAAALREEVRKERKKHNTRYQRAKRHTM